MSHDDDDDDDDDDNNDDDALVKIQVKISKVTVFWRSYLC